MGALGDLLKELQKGQITRAEEYDRVLFPLGQEQKRKEEALLGELVKSGLSAQERLFLLVTAREAQWAQEPKDHLILLRNWMDGHLLRYITPEEAALIFGQAELCRRIGSLEEIPTADQVRERAPDIYQRALLELREAESNHN